MSAPENFLTPHSTPQFPERGRFAFPGGTTTQGFPARRPASEHQTAWTVTWDYTRNENPTGSLSNLLLIKHAEFRRAPGEDPIPIVADLRVPELFTAYNNGTRLYDVTGPFNYELLPASTDDFHPGAIIPSQMMDPYLVREVICDDIRWKRPGIRHHGESLRLWAALNAGNYCYLIEYNFRDDGTIVCRVGAGGHNLTSISIGREPHVHIPCWRIEPVIGSAEDNHVETVHIRQHAEGGTVELNELRDNREGGVVVDPRDFAAIRVTNSRLVNQHLPDPKPTAYDLMPLAPIGVHTHGPGEEFTHADFWVTRANPASPHRTGPELNYAQIPQLAAAREPLAGHPIVIWHHAPIVHIPRDEDFGYFGYNVNNGVAMTTWIGFEFKPRNLFSHTPFYPSPPAP